MRPLNAAQRRVVERYVSSAANLPEDAVISSCAHTRKVTLRVDLDGRECWCTVPTLSQRTVQAACDSVGTEIILLRHWVALVLGGRMPYLECKVTPYRLSAYIARLELANHPNMVETREGVLLVDDTEPTPAPPEPEQAVNAPQPRTLADLMDSLDLDAAPSKKAQ